MGMITTSLNARTNVLLEASGTDLLRDIVVQLQEERGGELWGLARHLGLSPDEADDAVQETMLRLWTALRDGTAIERPDAWAFRLL
jgi:DNA-directed RNA polymerase specialized sigma24 family protein